MSDVITTIEEVTPDWLTTVLRRSGELPRGSVRTVTPEGNPAFNSAVTHLALTLSPAAPSSAPTRVLLKRNINEEWAIRAGATEVAFYTLVESQSTPLPVVPRRYDAAYDAVSGASHLLLRDLTDTHVAPRTRDDLLAGNGVPSMQHLAWVIEAVARFHTYWWENPALGHGVAAVSEWCRDEDSYRRHIERREVQWAGFIRDVGDWFPADLRALYAHALAHLHTLWAPHIGPRIAARSNVTLLHGDCYVSNTLVPRTSGAGTTTLIDFQNVSADFGAGDLVNLLATFWTREQRQDGQREERALRHYHETLLTHGIGAYAWGDVLTDYRLMLIDWIFVPIWDQTNGSSQDYWYPKMKCLTAAFQDWRCDDLL